jgi:hypothetical protein
LIVSDFLFSLLSHDHDLHFHLLRFSDAKGIYW